MTKGLSIDPNTKQSGLVYWQADEVTRVMTFASATQEPRYLSMAWMLYDEVRYAPGLAWVAVEGIYAGPNAQVTMQLARIVGCIELAARQAGVRYHELSTLEIDRGCNIRYQAGQRKAETAGFALMNGHPEMDEHQADAFCVGYVIAQQENRRRLIDEAKGSAA